MRIYNLQLSLCVAWMIYVKLSDKPHIVILRPNAAVYKTASEEAKRDIEKIR